MRPGLGMLSVAAAAVALAVGARASESYTFSGTASYQTFAYGNTGGSYSFTFTSPDAVDSSSPGYQYVYDATGEVTLTPSSPEPYNPVVTGALAGTYTIVSNQTAGDVFVFDTSSNTDFEVGSVGSVDLTTPGTYSATFANSSVYGGYFYLTSGNGGSDVLIETPTSGVTLTIAPSAVPEPAGWSLMIVGSALAGAAARRRRQVRQLPARI